MSRKIILQYLEFLKLSGIQDIYLNEVKTESSLELSTDSHLKDTDRIELPKTTSEHVRKPSSTKPILSSLDIDIANLTASQKEELLQKLNKEYSNCQNCVLGKTRHNLVYGNGSATAKLMLIAEGPGADEDASGEVFVGKAGQLLTKMLQAIKINREDVYICNIVKCRPPNNRNPLPEERSACLPYLLQQLDIVQPERLLLLGKVAAETLLGVQNNMAFFRSKIHSYRNIPTYVTYHPAALLRNVSWKKFAWVDLQNLQKDYETLL